MESQDILLYADARKEWAALLVDGRLQDLFSHHREVYMGPWRGDICAAHVTRTVAGGRSAFVDLGDGCRGFLSRAMDLDPGDRILVQVDRFSFENKATRVRENIWLSGPLVILVRDGDGVAVSRRIGDPELREELIDLLDPLADDVRVVVRTAAAGVAAEDLYQEVLASRERLARLEAAAGRGEPRALERAPRPALRALEDWAVGNSRKILAAGGRIEEALGDAGPENLEILGAEGDLLRHDDLDGQLREILQPRVEVAGGGWFSIEPTRALVAVDVNTGGGELRGFPPGEIGCAAAREIPRQLRLRGLGGIVVVDFPGSSERDRDRIEDEIARSLAADRVPGRAHGWTEAGLFEVTRLRDRRPARECFGDG